MHEPADDDDYERIARELWHPVLRYFWKRTSAEDARDLAQREFLDGLRALQGGHAPDLDDVRSWRRYLIGQARNRWLDHRRRIGVDAVPEAVEARLRAAEAPGSRRGNDAGELALAGDRLAAVRTSLERVDARTRAVCWLHYVDGAEQDDAEVARGIERLSACLREEGAAVDEGELDGMLRAWGAAERAAAAGVEALEPPAELLDPIRAATRRTRPRPVGRWIAVGLTLVAVAVAISLVMDLFGTGGPAPAEAPTIASVVPATDQARPDEGAEPSFRTGDEVWLHVEVDKPAQAFVAFLASDLSIAPLGEGKPMPLRAGHTALGPFVLDSEPGQEAFLVIAVVAGVDGQRALAALAEAAQAGEESAKRFEGRLATVLKTLRREKSLAVERAVLEHEP